MHIGLVYILYEVLITRSAGLRTYAATALLAEVSQWGTLNVTQVRNGNNHIVIGIHILRIELSSHLNDTGATLVSILLFNLHEFVLDHLIAHGLAGEKSVEVLDKFLQLSILLFEFVDTQTCQLRETHIHNRFRLQVIEVEACLQVGLRIRRSAACADNLHYLVNIIYGNNQALQNVCTLFGFLQLIFRTANYYLHTVLNEVGHHIVQVQQLWTTLHERNTVH